jgi:aminotransferase in exopolysaccharide biosynthesis
LISDVVKFIREIYGSSEAISLHEPSFEGNDLIYLTEAVKSTYVSSVGKFVNDFEKKLEVYTNTPKAILTVNGTAALHTALHVAGVVPGDVVITQALTFVATCNAVHHMGAEPAFVDVSKKTMGMCPDALKFFLEENAVLEGDKTYLKSSRKPITAVVPMHTFGHPVEMDEILEVCKKWKLIVVEDAAESLGSFYKGRHTGTMGQFGTVSFNGNKIITTGGGGAVLCSSLDIGERVKHVTTTAKVAHPYEFIHDEAGFNYRMPNLNAALGCAQIEMLDGYLMKKRKLAMHYKDYFNKTEYTFFDEPTDTKSNFWLNTLICADLEARDSFLKQTNNSGVMTRPVWQLMNKLPMYINAPRGTLVNSEWFESRAVNIPSSPVRN